jgi:integrase/recombinase XerD
MDRKLLLKLSNHMSLRGLSIATKKSYLRHLGYLQKVYHRKDFKDLSFNNILSYLAQFKDARHFSVGYYRQARAAIVLLFKNVIKKKWHFSDIPPMRSEHKLPDILNTDEVLLILNAATHPRDKTIISLLYSTGLRITEACNLRISDIDSTRMTLHIRNTKSKRDRFVMLSPVLLKTLRDYYRSCLIKPKDFLFPNSSHINPINRSTAWYRIRGIVKKAGLRKRVYPHIFRHSFATHMLENGANLRSIQAILGHYHLNTTAIYTHLTTNFVSQLISPLDALVLNSKKRNEAR